MKYLEFVCEFEDEFVMNIGVLIVVEFVIRKVINVF